MKTPNAPELVSITLDVDEKGYRTYTVIYQVWRTDINDLAFTSYNTQGLPQVGDAYNFGNEFDPWCWCRPETKVEKFEDPQGNYWHITKTFSNKPLDICRQQPMEDPLLEPWKITGTFQVYQEEATQDMDGNKIVNSGFEPIRGPQATFDRHRTQIKIQQNVADLQGDLLESMINTVNDSPLWGFQQRCVKLSGCPFEKKYWGQCEVYWTRTLEFDIDMNLPIWDGSISGLVVGRLLGGFDRVVLDDGTKVMNGRWGVDAAHGGTDPTNQWIPLPLAGPPDINGKFPSKWIAFRGRDGEAAHCIVTADGNPIGHGIPGVTDDPNNIAIYYYQESDFTQLGIPLDLSQPYP
jgi:hypothetical protein